MKKLVLALLLILMAASIAVADTIYLRDGRTVRGTVLGFVNGRFAVRLTDNLTGNTSAGQNSANGATNNRTTTGAAGDVVFLRPNEIERIEIDGRSLDEARFVSHAVEVGLGPNWVDSGVDLRRGDHVEIKANGTIYAGRMRITPDGLRSTDPNAPLPRAAEGVLIGTVGNDPSAPITELGTSREFIADRDGRLYLTANRSNYTDARGSYQVQIRTERELPGRNARNNNNAGRTDDNRNNNNDDYDAFGTGNDNGGRAQPAPVRPRSGGIQDQQSNSNQNRVTREKTIDVAANLARGVDTGIDLRSGDQVQITATGNITAGRRAGVVSPDGGRASTAAAFGAGTYPVPTAGVGALIGYIRQTNGQLSQPFLIGSQQTLTLPVDGRLFLLVNDDNYGDNSGSFSVRLVYPETTIR